MLEITDGHRIFALSKRQAKDLELKLNVSFYGHPLKHIGDILFNFSTNRPCALSLRVSKEQYQLLELLMAMDYNDCKGFIIQAEGQEEDPGTD